MQTFSDVAAVKNYDAMRVRWTRDDCEALEHAGVLNYRYELIAESLLRRSPVTISQARVVREVMLWFADVFGEERIVSHAAIHVGRDDDATNVPEPDIILLNKPDTDVPTDQPRPEDIRLLIEVADSTKDYDLGTKAALYARAGIPEYRVVSTAERRVYVHTNPQPEGSYTRREAKETGSLTPPGAPPSAAKLVRELLPPNI